jgi:hypothetical protein
MRSRLVLAVLMPIALLQADRTQQATIEDTGSTNVPGTTLIVSGGGSTKVQPHGSEPHAVSLDRRLSQRFFDDLKSAGRLSDLPHAHCMKSVSFGSSLYIEFNGERSPDLNCPARPDSKLSVLQKDVREIMQAVRVESGINQSRVPTRFRK